VTRYRITHQTSYRYDDDVTGSFGRAHLLPRDTERQTCEHAEITVTPAPAEVREHTDWFGNRSTYFAVTTPHRALTVSAESVVTITAEASRPAAPSWEAVRDRLAVGVAPAEHGDERAAEMHVEARGYALPSPRLPPLAAATDYARTSFPAGRSTRPRST
jgi:transglutaminase-like putative cysteine protease